LRKNLLTALGIKLASYASNARLFPYMSLMLMYLVTSLFPEQMSDVGSMPLIRLLLHPFFR
jgi:hypothetical protein